MASRSGSSRRKPLVAKKVFDDKESSDDENEDPQNGMNGDKDDSNEEMPDLPEGTVVVNPEPVEDKGSPFKGPEFGSSKRRSAASDPNKYLSIVTCTACRKQINTNKKGAARKHPLLKVLICKRCHTYYESGPISKDEDGLDEQCRWCSEGGRLFGCDYCHNAFCRSCVIHNLGRSEISRIEDHDKWKCYVCNPRPLSDLIENCNTVLEHIKKEELKVKKAIEAEKLKKAQDSSKKNDQTKQEKKSSTPQPDKQQEKKGSTPTTKDLKAVSKPSTGALLSGALRTANVVHVSPAPAKNVVSTSNMKTNVSQAKGVVINKVNTTSGAGTTKYVYSYPITPRVNIAPKPLQFSSLLVQHHQAGQQAAGHQYPKPVQQAAMPSMLSKDLSLHDLFSTFKQNVNIANVRYKLDKLISMTSSLQGLLQSVRNNINDNQMPGFTPVLNMAQKSRETAVECMQGGLELFFQEFQILVGGNTKAVVQNGSATNAQSSTTANAQSSTAANAKSSATTNTANLNISKIEPCFTSTPLKSNATEDDSDVVILQDSPDKATVKNTKVNLDNPVKNTQENSDKSTAKESEDSCVVLDSDTDENDNNDCDVEMNIDSKKDNEKSSTEDKKEETTTEKNQSEPSSPGKNDTPKKDKPDSENAEAQLELLEELADEILNQTDSSDENGNDDEKDKESTPCKKRKSKTDEADEGDNESSSPKRKRNSRQTQDKENKDDDETEEEDVKKIESPKKTSKKRSTRSSQDEEEEDETEEKDAKEDVNKKDSTHKKSSRRRTRSSQDENDDTEEEESAEKKTDEKDGKKKDKTQKEALKKKRSTRSVEDADDETGDEDETEVSKKKSGKRSTRSRKDDDETEEETKDTSKKSSSKTKRDDSEDDDEDEGKKISKNRRSDKGKGKKADSQDEENEDDSSISRKNKSKKSSNSKSEKNGKKTSKDSKKKSTEKDDDDDDDDDNQKKKDKQTKGKGDESDDESDDSDDDTDSSEMSGGDTFGAKRRLRKRKAKDGESKSSLKLKIKFGSKKDRKSKHDSDSDNFDSDLENDIDKLSKDVKIKLKKVSADDLKAIKENEGKKSKKDSKKKTTDKDKKKSEKEDISDGSNDDTDDYDPEDGDDEEAMDIPDPADHDDMEVNQESDDDTDNNVVEDSSDSEIIINSPKKKKTSQKKGKKKDEFSDTDSDFDTKPKKKKLRGKLLDAKLSDSDSDVISPKKKGKKRKAKSESSEISSSSEESDGKRKKKGKGKAKGKGGKGKKSKKRRRIKKVSSSSDEEKVSSTDEDDPKEKESGDEEDSPKKGRKKIRKVLSDKKLTDKTKAAVKAEEERRQRIVEKQKLFNHIELEDDPTSPTKCPITKKLVLEMDKDNKVPVIEVHKDLVRKLKPHQVEAVQFVWNCTIESLERLKKEEGSGCILAHCMGLGKTLSVIAFLHTVMTHAKKTKIEKTLVVCPLNTVLNWQHEFEMWIEEMDPDFYEVFELASVKQNVDRAEALKYWHENGGIMILGYEMYRNLIQGSFCRSKKLKKIFRDCLVDPGPDFVVCDEGHILKNDGSAISKAMNLVKTRRRVVLTGTPLQNNLTEYHCMVSFVKPNLLGTRKEFSNRFINPITNGQCTDSTAHDVKIMKRRAHILHEKLNGCVQRKDYSALTKFLAPKHEYVLSVRLSKTQIDLYSKYLELVGISQDGVLTVKKGRLFSDYQALMRIWTHPWVLKMDEIRQEMKAKWDDEDSFIDDSDYGGTDEESESLKSKSSSSEDDILPVSDSDEDTGKRKTRASRSTKDTKKEEPQGEENTPVTLNSKEVVKKWTTRSRGGEGIILEEEEIKPLTTEWWAEFVTEEDETKMELSGKLVLLFEILRQCEEIGDKVLVFSQSLLSLSLIESFLERVDKKFQEDTEGKEDSELLESEAFGKRWTKGEDYFRMDGSTSAQQRKDLAASFNDPENFRTRLFLISTKAGGLGINLVAANRVIIFDASWNPSHDIQSIFRVYRFGQAKPVYVYRFLAQGTMEEKIYERQVTKQSLSQRVVDEHQIERHFNSRDLQELYNFKPDRLDDSDGSSKPTPKLPSDHMLAEMLKSHKQWIVGYHEHDSLLENQIDQELSEEERKAAWKEYEDEKKGIYANVQQHMGFPGMPGNMAQFGMPQNMNMGMPSHMNIPGLGMNMGMNMGVNMGMNMSLNQHNLLQLVQDMKQRFPHLPEDQLTHRVQGVIRQIITGQFMRQQEMQKRQIEQREFQHQQQLQQIQAQIQRQKQQLNQHHLNQTYQPPNPVPTGTNMSLQSMLGESSNPSTSGGKTS